MGIRNFECFQRVGLLWLVLGWLSRAKKLAPTGARSPLRTPGTPTLVALTAAEFLVDARVGKADKEPENGGRFHHRNTHLTEQQTRSGRLFAKFVLKGHAAAGHMPHWSKWYRHRRTRVKANHCCKPFEAIKRHESPQRYSAD